MAKHKTELQELLKPVVDKIVKNDVIICEFYLNPKDFAMLVYNDTECHYHWFRLQHPLHERGCVNGCFKTKSEAVVQAITDKCEIHTFESMDQVFKWSELK